MTLLPVFRLLLDKAIEYEMEGYETDLGHDLRALKEGFVGADSHVTEFYWKIRSTGTHMSRGPIDKSISGTEYRYNPVGKLERMP